MARTTHCGFLCCRRLEVCPQKCYSLPHFITFYELLKYGVVCIWYRYLVPSKVKSFCATCAYIRVHTRVHISEASVHLVVHNIVIDDIDNVSSMAVTFRCL
jgi:hypothetical protein